MRKKQPSWFEETEKFLLRLIQYEGADQGKPWNIRLLLAVLHGCSCVFRLIVQTRLALYELGILRRFPLGCQVISVGNITVGGTGKTPVVETFARELAAAGRKVAILSRGYRKEELPWWSRLRRRSSRTPRRGRNAPDGGAADGGAPGPREKQRPWWYRPRVVSDGRTVLLDSAKSGDEPFMLATNLPGVVVLVDKDRVKSGRYAIRHFGCDTLLLDDGFQYQRLKHAHDVVLVDRTNPFSNGHMLPRGVLREPIQNLKRANFLFITKCDGSSTEALRRRIRAINPKVEILECRHQPQLLRDVYTREELPLSWLVGKKVSALSGIASPGGFESSLRALGAKVLACERFVDHHRFSRKEILDVLHHAAFLDADAVITTEKDAVRIPKIDLPPVPIYFLRMDIEILRGAENFRQYVEHICFKRPLSGVETFDAAL
ncbi:MAG: tetraacyldisaccharide 4'-kinase [Kiritimatiellia bacterium]|jgi:tetraacyldisaccharide 4'-kinase